LPATCPQSTAAESTTDGPDELLDIADNGHNLLSVGAATAANIRNFAPSDAGTSGSDKHAAPQAFHSLWKSISSDGTATVSDDIEPAAAAEVEGSPTVSTPACGSNSIADRANVVLAFIVGSIDFPGAAAAGHA
jgi:hypothetical protein